VANGGIASRRLPLVFVGGHIDRVVGMRPEGEQIVGGLRRGARGANDGAVILAQHLELSAAAHNVKERDQIG
jgi:hypothetical protein